jgi:protein-tyrosine phosphatase
MVQEKGKTVFYMDDKQENSPALDASVSRIDSHTVELRWRPEGGKPSVAVCSGLRRTDAMREIPVSEAESAEGCVRIAGLVPTERYYFHLKNDDGRRVVMGERQVALEGAVNFRDIGGYKTGDGREVKWGKVFRSDGLARLTARDHAVLRKIGIGRVYDFRTPAEIAEAPDNLPEDGSVVCVNLPVTHGKIDFVHAMTQLKKGDISWLSPDFMVEGYIRNIEEAPHVWGEVINSIADLREPAMLFHCTGGKDRTGTCAALILSMLGVDEDTVISDHQLSNTYIADMLPKVFELVKSYGVDPEKLLPYFTAPLEGIEALLDHLRGQYGSAADYLAEQAGVKRETQERLKDKLLR